MYADNNTQSMKNAMNETKRRREKQIQYNKDHGIIPKTIIKSVPEQEIALDDSKLKSTHDLATEIIDLDAQMKKYSEELDFERAIEAIECRDRIKRIEKEIEFKNGRK
jgi:excinuclease ABC subunit B